MSRSLRLILAALRAHPFMTFMSVSLVLVSAIFQVVIPLLTGSVIDLATDPVSGLDTPITRLFSGLDALTSTVVALVVIALVQWAVNVARRWSQSQLALGTQHSIRVRVLDRLQRLDGPGQNRIVTGQVASRAISDLNQVHLTVTLVPISIGRLAQLVITLVVMAFMAPGLTLISLTMLPLLALTAFASRATVHAATWESQKTTAELATHVEQTVTGVRVVKAFAQEDREVETLDALSRHLYAVKMRVAKITARFQPLMAQIPRLALVATILVGGFMALRGTISVGTFFVFTTYLTSLTQGVSMLAGVYFRYQLATSSLERIDDLLQMEPLNPEYDHPPSPRALPEGPLGLEFEDVSFAFGNNQVLKGVTMSVAPASSLSMVGGPGSGKSVAVQVAAGFYKPDSGRVALVSADGERFTYEELDVDDIRTAITVVGDDAFLYSTSVRNNISMGHDVTDAEVEQAARLAQAHEFIVNLDDGYDTVVGERGLTLSGGQRQRIALARALLSRPRILILDDATSAVDAATEKAIIEGLRAELEDVTVVTVAHRRSTLALTDASVVFVDGRIDPAADVLPTEAPTGPLPSQEVLWPADPPASALEDSLDTPPPELEKRIAALPPATEMPGLDADTLKSKRGSFRVRDLFGAVKWLIVLAVALMVVGVVTDLAFPILVQTAVDRGVGEQSPETFWVVTGIGLLIVAVSWIASAWNTVITSRSGERLLYGLRLRSFSHLQRLSMDYFEKTMAGRIMTRMTTDIDTLSRFLQTALAEAVVSLGTLVGIVILLLVTDVSLAMIAFIAIPLLVVATIIFRRIAKRLYTAAREQISAVNTEFQENISGIQVAQLHQRTGPALTKFAAGSARYRDLRVRSTVVASVYFAGVQATTQIVSAAVLGYGAIRVSEGSLSAGVLIAFLMYLSQLFGPIQSLGTIFDSWQQATVSFSRITDLLDTKPTIRDTGTRSPAETTEAARGTLALANVDFAYDTALVLEDLNLRIPPGSTVALVGPTGSGKSSVVKLLARFYDPTSGQVTASNTDIREFPLMDWRASMVQVPQEAHLFIGTVADNIRYGRPEATDQEVEEATRAIGALNVIATIPGGFNAPVGERGRGLSAGQRQIIALARAEIMDPEVVLLDEATASLDPATETAFLQASRRATRERTSVVIAHRLATAAHADHIVVIEDGRIVEEGNHEDLRSNGGTYARMWEIQE